MASDAETVVICGQITTTSASMRSLKRRVLATAVAVGLSFLAAGPALAHGEDPTLVTVLSSTVPALPPGVIVQVRTGVSEQMVVANPTGTPLDVLDPADAPFVRVSDRGVFGNVDNPYFHRTLNPPGTQVRLPDSAREGAPPRWVKISQGESWGWFEPRLHPFEPGAEPVGVVPEAAPPVATWRVGMQLGSTPIQVSGVLERRVATGAFRAEADQRDDGLEVALGQGRVPALLLVLERARSVEIDGADGVAFLRHDSRGVFANPNSVSFRDNPDFADRQAGKAGKAGRAGRAGWVRVGDPGRMRWLDTRLQYSADRPPEVVERAGQVAELGRWEIPARVDGKPAALGGVITWVPLNTDLAALTDDSGLPLAAMGGGALVLVCAGTVLVNARRRARA